MLSLRELLPSLILICTLCQIGCPAEEAIEKALGVTYRVTDQKTSGTCLIVSLPPRNENGRRRLVLLTAAHVLEGMPAPDTTLVLRETLPDGDYARREIRIPIRHRDRPLWKRHPELDVAGLRLQLAESSLIQPLPVDLQTPESSPRPNRLRVGQTVCIPCYPATLEANPQGFPVLRKGSIATFPLVPVSRVKTIMIDSSTFGGDSGAPVFDCSGEEPVLVAMVLGTHRQTDKVTMPYEERTVHTPLGLSMAVQADYVWETLKQLDNDRPER